MEEPDEFWVRRALKTPNAFEELVLRYQQRVYNLAYRLLGHAQDAEDVAQEAFLRSYAALASFEPGSKFAPWLFKIATNLCLNRLKARRSLEPLEDELDVPSGFGVPERAYESLESQRQVQQAILDLPVDYRVALVLRHINGLSYDEIAAVLNIPLGTVKTRLFRAREVLMAKLSVHEVER